MANDPARSCPDDPVPPEGESPIPRHHRARGGTPGPRPTLKTISQMTGLAIATVSRALHDAPDIGEATKRRVNEAAMQIGYRPNRAGVRLRTGKTNVISLVLASDHDAMNHTARLISSVAGALRDTPYHLIVTPRYPDEDPMAPVRYIVESGSADAMILNQIEPEDPRIAWLLQLDFPFATHGRTVWRDRHAWFDWDNRRFGEIAGAELLRRGRRNILLLAPHMSQNFARDIHEGAGSVLGPAGVRYSVIEGATSDDRLSHVETTVRGILERDPGIDAVISPSTSACMAVVAAAEDCGHRIGETLDIFSKEALPFLKRFRKGILSVNEDVSTAGEFLARAAIQRIAQPDLPPMQGLEVPRY